MDEEVEKLFEILSKTVGELSTHVNVADEFLAVSEVKVKINELELAIYKAQKVFEQEIS